MHIVERTCTEEIENGLNDLTTVNSQPLYAHDQLSAYVLLGEPGVGKSTTFEQEANRDENSLCLSARELITFDDRPEWHNKTLFIDGLDEIRAGSYDARTPFDAVRAKLDMLGRPRFRLSCREADWFGASDQDKLKAVSSNNQVTILHLDPLTESDIVEILEHNSNVSDAKKFMLWAKQKGLKELLTNPQVLDMLVKATTSTDTNWPDTRKQTFELACRTIIREHNDEHVNANRNNCINELRQLNAIGLLCAIQLISGNAGYALTQNDVVTDFPYIGDVTDDNSNQLLHDVIRTKLYKKSYTDEQRTPVHRTIAEYLAAVFITKLIDYEAFPIGRILALITGSDGVVVTELRGLSAWLAALCKSQRLAIIERDPLGVVLYGDVQGFTIEEKRHVLEGLQREATRYTWFRLSNWRSSPFGALATPDMEDEFRKILTSSDRSESHQALVDCVLDALAHGSKLKQLDDCLLDIVRDSTWWPRIRKPALKVIRRFYEAEQFVSDEHFKLLLDDILDGRVLDSDDELMGFLLNELYPRLISATEIFDYFHALKQRNTYGSYLGFWHQNIMEQSLDSDVCVLLDEIVKRLDYMQPILDDHHIRDLTAGLLARGLNLFGESIDSERLYEWLAVGLDRYGRSNTGPKTYIEDIRLWLEAHPEKQKQIIRIGLDRCAKKENFKTCIHMAQARLFFAKPPVELGLWYLEQIQVAVNDDDACFLLRESVDSLFYQRGDKGLILEIIQENVEQQPKQKAWLNKMLVCSIEEKYHEYNNIQRRQDSEQYKSKQQWLRRAKSHEIEIREGRAPIHLLKDLATAYFGYFGDATGDTPLECLRTFLDNDESLIQSTFIGLKKSLERDDVPEVNKIIEFYKNNQTHFLQRPYLAGLAEFTTASVNDILQLDNNQIRKAIAFILTEGSGEDPQWYKHLIKTRPTLVAEIFIIYVTAALRSKKQHITGLYALAYISEYSSIAKLVSIPLLKIFPVRTTSQQILSFDEILTASLRYANRQELLLLIEKKYKLTSMNLAQRVRWLACGMIINPEKYLELLTRFVAGKEIRIQHLVGFLADRYDQWSPINDFPVYLISQLILLIGRFYAPYSLNNSSAVTPSMNAADFVIQLINHLGSQPVKEATKTLETLLEDEGMIRWHTVVQRAHFEQRVILRESNFIHPSIRQVNETLNNRTPSNVSDLAALCMDKLHELAYEIRNGNTNDYRQYWNEGPRRQFLTSKHEDACRDALLSDLKQGITLLEIDAQPEGYYADGKRADIRVSFGGSDGFEVPIEIKKNAHQKLWSAMHNQLIAQYTREPRTNGFGIYLVFWFGLEVTQAPPYGQRPRTAEELESRLRATLTIDEKRKISVCVIDVSKPES